MNEIDWHRLGVGGFHHYREGFGIEAVLVRGNYTADELRLIVNELDFRNQQEVFEFLQETDCGEDKRG